MQWIQSPPPNLDGRRLFHAEQSDLHFSVIKVTPLEVWGGPANWFRYEPGHAWMTDSQDEMTACYRLAGDNPPALLLERLAYCVFGLNQFGPRGRPFTLQHGVGRPSYPANPDTWNALIFPDTAGDTVLKPDAVINANVKAFKYLSKTLFPFFPDFHPEKWGEFREARKEALRRSELGVSRPRGRPRGIQPGESPVRWQRKLQRALQNPELKNHYDEVTAQLAAEAEAAKKQ
jgi:hypothetical protein